MKKLLLLSICMLCLLVHVLSQTFIASAGKSQKDTAYVLQLISTGGDYQYSNLDTCLSFARKALDLSRQLKYDRGEALSLNLIGIVLMRSGNYSKALETLLEGLQKSEKQPNKKTRAQLMINLGALYYEQGEIKTALNYLNNARPLLEEARDTANLVYVLVNSGDDYDVLGMYDSARINTMMGYLLALKTGDTSMVGTALNNLGNIHLKQKLYTLALEYYRLSIIYYKMSKNYEGACEADIGMAKTFMGVQQPDSALKYAHQSLAAAQQYGFTKYMMGAAAFLTDYYKARRINDSALAYQNIVVAAKDSLFNQEKVQQIANLSFQEKLRQQEIAQQQEQERIQRRNTLQIIGFAIFIMLFTLFALLIAPLRTKLSTVHFLVTVAFLLIFEFISYLVHPIVYKMTNYQPAWVLVGIMIVAGIVAPVHHKLEKFFKEKMSHKMEHPIINPKRKKIVKKVSDADSKQ